MFDEWTLSIMRMSCSNLSVMIDHGPEQSLQKGVRVPQFLSIDTVLSTGISPNTYF